jgi:hypothetical protein
MDGGIPLHPLVRPFRQTSDIFEMSDVFPLEKTQQKLKFLAQKLDIMC